ncbi:hypothetical protein [Silvibacterium acidisoli]|uniref:hypothetical protein n=1 Tax=Acidobacteriaceae bacterium ZG23-2 TaxID=2883246 RepID=UPI00406CD96F
MRLPQQQQPVRRALFTENNPSATGVTPSSCAGVPTSIIGRCFDQNGNIPGNWNCAACCALRGAISWQGGGLAVAC